MIRAYFIDGLKALPGVFLERGETGETQTHVYFKTSPELTFPSEVVISAAKFWAIKTSFARSNDYKLESQVGNYDSKEDGIRAKLVTGVNCWELEGVFPTFVSMKNFVENMLLGRIRPDYPICATGNQPSYKELVARSIRLSYAQAALEAAKNQIKALDAALKEARGHTLI